MTVTEAYEQLLQQLLTIYDQREAEHISNWVIEHYTGLKRLDRMLNKHTVLASTAVRSLEHATHRLVMHEPVQYVLGEAWFYKRKFYVDFRVLIPRPETEELVEWVVNNLERYGTGTNIIDIGTGSGCIPICLKNEVPMLTVTSIDVSPGALEVAGKNAEELRADVSFVPVDFLDNSQWEQLPIFDYIISNPPYIPAGEKSRLSSNVTEYEPGIALFVPDNDPFIFYKKIKEFSDKHLATRGSIYMEIHEDLAPGVRDVFTGFDVEIRKDIYGRDRMVKASRV